MSCLEGEPSHGNAIQTIRHAVCPFTMNELDFKIYSNTAYLMMKTLGVFNITPEKIFCESIIISSG